MRTATVNDVGQFVYDFGQRSTRQSLVAGCVAVLFLAACTGSSEEPLPSGSGGAALPGSGGASTAVPATGGTPATGGAQATGGANATGGATATATGGASQATGGAPPATGGTSTATGGKATGGTKATGGAATGGSVTDGGKSTDAGGATTGGQTSNGGSATGGVVGAGGSGKGGAATGGSVTATGGSGGGGTGTPGNYPLGNDPVKSSGCGKTQTIAAGTNTINGRQYIIRYPSGYTNTKPYKLVIAPHWMGGSMTDVDTGQTVTRNVWSYYGLQQLDTGGTTIFVAPQGNNCGTWCKADETFITNIINAVSADSCIDTSRIFATGFSYGAIFSYALACDLGTTFRAVAALAAAQNISNCGTGTSNVAYWAEVGMSDTLCSPALGRACRDTWVKRNGCTASSSVPEWKSGAHVCYSYEGCKAGYPVRWCTGNYGHIAAPNDATTGDNGNTTWAKTETWTWFSQF